MLLDLRLFTMPKEDLFYPNIASTVSSHIRDDEIRADVTEFSDSWDQSLIGRMRPVVDGKSYTTADAFNLLVNGDLFHIDVDKAREFAELAAVYQAMLRHAVREFAINALPVLVGTANLVAVAFNNDLFDFDHDEVQANLAIRRIRIGLDTRGRQARNRVPRVIGRMRSVFHILVGRRKRFRVWVFDRESQTTIRDFDWRSDEDNARRQVEALTDIAAQSDFGDFVAFVKSLAHPPGRRRFASTPAGHLIPDRNTRPR